MCRGSSIVSIVMTHVTRRGGRGKSTATSPSLFNRHKWFKMSKGVHALAKGYPAPRHISPVLVWILVPIATALICHPLLPSLAAVIPYLPFQVRPWFNYELPAFPGLQASLGFSLIALLGALWSVPGVGQAFKARGLHGKDMLKGSRAAVV